jgi:metallophosphoesterase superfamily enzyme
MNTLIGKWVLESHENFEQFLKEQGMNHEMIQTITSLKPTLEIIKTGDEYTVIHKGGIKEEEPFKFKHMEEVYSKGIQKLFIKSKSIKKDCLEKSRFSKIL